MPNTLHGHFAGFREILENRASVHPFENVQCLLPPNSWFGIYPVPGKQETVILI